MTPADSPMTYGRYLTLDKLADAQHPISDEHDGLRDKANAALARAGFDVPASTRQRDWTQPYEPDPAVEAAWAQVYSEPHRWWELYQLAEKLVDIDDALATLRHKHVLTMTPVIGMKTGTDGMPGAAYLTSTLTKRAFPELRSPRTQL